MTPSTLSPLSTLETSYSRQLTGQGIPQRVARLAAIDMAAGLLGSSNVKAAYAFLQELWTAEAEGDALKADLDRLAAEDDG